MEGLTRGHLWRAGPRGTMKGSGGVRADSLVRMVSQQRRCGGSYWEKWESTPSGRAEVAGLVEGQRRTDRVQMWWKTLECDMCYINGSEEV